MEERQECGTCRYAYITKWRDSNGRICVRHGRINRGDRPATAVCRRYPPRVHIDPSGFLSDASFHTRFPQVDADDACGEWAARTTGE